MNHPHRKQYSENQGWQRQRTSPRKLPTFWQNNLLQEVGVLALLLLLFTAIGVATLRELRRRYFMIYRAAADNVELVLSDQLQQARHQLIRFSQLPDNSGISQTAQLLVDFSELYELNSQLSITKIYKRLPSSQVFTGFSFSRSPLVDYLTTTRSTDAFSPLLRGVEDSRASIYIALPHPGGVLLGRLNLETLQRFLRQFASAAQTPVIIVARDGSILLSSDPNLRIPTLPLDGSWDQQVIREPLELAGQEWIPIATPARLVGATIVTLVPTKRQSDKQQQIISMLAGVSLASGVLLALKSLQQRRLFIKPIAQLADKMRSLEAGQPDGVLGTDASPREFAEARRQPPARFAELDTLQSAFGAMAGAIREREQKLRQSEQQHRLLADNALDVITICDPSGKPTYISPSVERVRGWSVAEAMALPMEQHLRPEGYAIVRNALAQTQDAVRRSRPLPSFRVELQQSHKNGTWVWTDVTSSCILDEAGVYIGTLLVYRDISERKRLEDELQQRAASDELTGLLNRRALLEKLETLLAQPDQRHRAENLALMFCDLDLFKEINDTLGHSVGDLVLRATAERICLCLRSGDLAARVGGDEMVVVLHNITNQDAAMSIAEQISRSIAEPITSEGLQIGITASIGVTMARRQEGVDELIARADRGMYQAKQAGRNRVIRIA